MIVIHKGKVENLQDRSVMTTNIEIDGRSHNVVVAVSNEYGKFLAPERSDYAIVGMLAYAMRNKHDIICEVPATDELLYRLQEMLIPTLVYSDSRNYRVNIQADMASSLDKISGGGGDWYRFILRRRQFSCRLETFKF